MSIKIFKKFVDQDKIQETTLTDAIDKLESPGWWEHGSVESMLKKEKVVYTPYCKFAVKKELLLNN